MLSNAADVIIPAVLSVIVNAIQWIPVERFCTSTALLESQNKVGIELNRENDCFAVKRILTVGVDCQK